MPRPHAQPKPKARGNSAVTAFKPTNRWALEEQCAICQADFSVLRTRHHCRYCGLSVCGKHSRNKLVVPTSLSTVAQRVCDRCYPICQSARLDGVTRQQQQQRARGRTMDETPQRRRGRSTDGRGQSSAARSDGSNGSYDSYDKYESGALDKLPRHRSGTGSTWNTDTASLASAGSAPLDSRTTRTASIESSFTTPRHVRSARERGRVASPRRSSGVTHTRRRVASAVSADSKHEHQMHSPKREAVNTQRDEKTEESIVIPASRARPLPFRRPGKTTSRDSSFSIFSLASDGEDDSDSDSGASYVQNKSRVTRTRPSTRPSSMRPALKQKQRLDFRASTSSVASFEMSAITNKYLAPTPEDKERVSSSQSRAKRKASATARAHAHTHVEQPQDRRRRAGSRDKTSRGARPESAVRGAYPKSRAQLPPFRRVRSHNSDDAKPEEAHAHLNHTPHKPEWKQEQRLQQQRSEDEDVTSQDRKPAVNSGGKSSATISSSDVEELDDVDSAQSVSSDECFSDEEAEALANLITAGHRASRRLSAISQSQSQSQLPSQCDAKAEIAGLTPAALGKTCSEAKIVTTVTYELSDKDRAIMRHVTALEARVRKQQAELPALLDKYREITERAKRAQEEVQEAKARVRRYQKAHATVSRAIRSGRMYMEQKEYLAAILELSRATAVERSNATLWYLLAECRLKVGQPAAAEEACMTSVSLQPTGAGVALLGRILHARGRLDEAVECYLSALGRDEEDVRAGD